MLLILTGDNLALNNFVSSHNVFLDDGLLNNRKMANPDIWSSLVSVLYNLLFTKTFGNYKGGPVL